MGAITEAMKNLQYKHRLVVVPKPGFPNHRQGQGNINRFRNEMRQSVPGNV